MVADVESYIVIRRLYALQSSPPTPSKPIPHLASLHSHYGVINYIPCAALDLVLLFLKHCAIGQGCGRRCAAGDIGWRPKNMVFRKDFIYLF